MTKNSSSMLSFMSSDELNKIVRLGQSVFYREDDVLFMKGDKSYNFYIVLSGSVVISVISEHGKEIVLNHLGKGDVFGEITMFDQETRTTNAHVKKGTRLASVEREDFLRYLDRNPSLYRAIISFLCRRLRYLSGHVESFTLANGFERLVSKIISMAERQYTGGEVVLEMSQADLAKMLDLSRESVNKNLQTLRARKLVELRRRRIIIPSVDVLKNIKVREVA